MRKKIDISKGWRFIREDTGLPDQLPQDWDVVDLPHTWNAVDGHDENGNYYRGCCWYAREFDTPVQPLDGGRVFVEIPAAGQQAAVYVNGTKICEHEGGYSTFRADITDACRKKGANLLAVACSNEYRSNVYPQSADFTFYGGLYRGMNLISVPKTHFDLAQWGSSGLKVTAAPVQGGAEFVLESWVINADENFTVQYSICDADGKEVGACVRHADNTLAKLYIPGAVLWGCDNPYLYTVTAVLQRRNEAYDMVSARTGVRSFSCDPQKGFILNGAPTPLRGVCRHQDMLYKGNALTREEHYRDARLIRELGANTIRLAHYQHSQDFYDACDELGFIVWAEIPFISVMNQDPAAHQNCITQMKELVLQNYNHPCICFWGLSNEILIGEFSDQLVENHKELNALCKKLDPTRLTTIAHVAMTPEDSPIHHITDVESYNHYFGWYVGKMEDNGPWLDDFHRKHPEICLGVSEYGCEGIVTYHGPNPACKDYSEEYQALYHEHMLGVIEERPWLWATHVWNMFDFGCAARNEGGVAGRNNKGLVTMDRLTKKDSYYIYKAYWGTEPMVHICGRRYARRAGDKLICVDGKTMRSNKRKGGKPNHIITAWSREDGFSLGQKVVNTKSNEVTAIPELLEKIRIKGQVVTIDAMGTQTAIAEKIRSKRGDYVLALKENQKNLYEDVRLFLNEESEKKKLRENGKYKKTVEKAHGQIEIREYYQTEEIRWLSQKKDWKGLKSIGMEEKTIQKDGIERKEYRYYISSLKEDVELFSRAVRGHWSVESMHWHLDVTFKEDANTTLDKQAAENLNIIRKWCLSILKMVEIFRPNLSMKKKRFVISMNPAEFIESIYY